MTVHDEGLINPVKSHRQMITRGNVQWTCTMIVEYFGHRFTQEDNSGL